MEWNEELMSIVQPEPVQSSENALRPFVLERARVFGKWLWLYFWVAIASIVPGIIAVVEEMSETGTIIGTLIGWCFSAVLVYAMFQLGGVQDRLRISAGLNAILVAAQILLHFVASETVNNLWSIPGAIIGLIASYQLMHGCGDALVGVDNELANKWYRLWKWYIWLLVGGVIGAPVLLLVVLMTENVLLAIVVVVVLLAWVVMVLVQAIKEYVYIYRTAKIFRGIAANL